MKKLLVLTAFLLCLAFTASAQMEMKEKAGPTEGDKTAAIPTTGYLKRGAPLTSADKVSLNIALAEPAKYAGKTVRIEGVVVRSCKSEGCWAEVAEKQGDRSVRITMKDHSFFIPLQSAGATARVEGTFLVKTLSREHVDHLIKEDGAKFDNRNADGTVTEVSFEATGIELQRKGN